MSRENKRVRTNKNECMLPRFLDRALLLHPLRVAASNEEMTSICRTAKDTELVHVYDPTDGLAFMSFRFAVGTGAWPAFLESKACEKMIGVVEHQVEERVKIGNRSAFLDIFYDENGYMRVVLCGYASKDDDLAAFLLEDTLGKIEKTLTGKESGPVISPKARDFAVREYLIDRKRMQQEISKMRREQFSDKR